ncbi:metal-dependent hydrolase [Halovivax limisalsi]|uniref:metal-dependent hydrolase n=1 Tax=Halovivax limisalsi TaxID=1453760 RepID=UPI001FFD1D26|nr:metal-dependent hydrolase [Halovivax limisalsi]
MPDVLAHVLIGYTIGTVLSIHYNWVGPESVTLVMIGALSPDFVKIRLLVPSDTVASLLGIPFAWTPLHTLGGSAIVILLGSLVLAREYRRQVIALLTIGALSHHALDLLLLTPTGYSYAVFWPLTEYRIPSGGLYRSSDRWPTVVAGLLATVAWYVRYRGESRSQ